MEFPPQFNTSIEHKQNADKYKKNQKFIITPFDIRILPEHDFPFRHYLRESFYAILHNYCVYAYTDGLVKSQKMIFSESFKF
jgi:hypothetical protein